MAQAINEANGATTDVGSCEAGTDGSEATGHDTITLPSKSTITLSATLPTITSSITIEGENSTISGDNQVRIFHITGGPVTINNLTMTKGLATLLENDYEGGAIYVPYNTSGPVLTINKSRFIDNSTPATCTIREDGAAIFYFGTSLTIHDSEFRGNRTGEGAAAVSTANITNLEIRRSSFTGHALPAGLPDTCDSGEVYVLHIGHTATISNVTVSGNSLSAIYIPTGTLTLSHSTIVGNEDPSTAREDSTRHFGGGLTQFHFLSFAGRAKLYNNIIADNSPYDCYGTQDASTWITARANNLIKDGTCSPPATAPSGDPKLASYRGAPGYHPLWQGSPAIDAATTNCASVDIRGVARSDGACDLGAYEGFIVPPPPDDDDGGPAFRPTDIPPPVPINRSLCAHCDELLAAGYRLSATHGLASGVQFRRLDSSGVGIQWVLDEGFRDAIDVWGFAEQGGEVCFPDSGRLLLLDAAHSPRQSVSVDAYSEGNLTCAAFDRAGTLVLLDGPPPPPVAVPVQAPPGHQPLQGCMVTTNYIVNFRESPGGAPIHFVDPWGAQIAGWLPHNVTLTALERTELWFKVDYHGTQGWIHADYVTTHGTCG